MSTTDLLAGLTQAEKVDVGTVLAVHIQATLGQSTANAEVTGRWGLIVQTQDGFAAGASPEPLEDHQANWYWNEAYFIDRPDVEEIRFERSLKTKRRLPSAEHTLIFSIESGAGSAGVLKYGFGFRLLYSHK